jgi:hypothetical protein
MRECGKPIEGKPNITDLVKLARKELHLLPEDIPDNAKAAGTIKKLLSNLGTIAHGLAEIRNDYGDGHGHDANFKGLQPRHARLAAGSASALVHFLFETHEQRKSRD